MSASGAKIMEPPVNTVPKPNRSTGSQPLQETYPCLSGFLIKFAHHDYRIDPKSSAIFGKHNA
ncbi:hypothetical protein CES85_0574 [Ochrobactrum quorumnocens]|uniref:Uncharacterized protein n=1 Tax=Ochrobactrum quorumnocens TaxID=271865 RepID=A0A248UH96_9HYPH|nr:hypothetical protein CES85_0574 [[Ochrobactrum] quorumnocens]